MNKDKITQAIKLILEARTLSILGQYGVYDTEYEDVRIRFDESIKILQSIIDENE